jgi:hypothetical protein
MKRVLSLVILLALAIAAATARAQYYDDRASWDKEREKRYAYLLGYHTGYSEGRDTRSYRVSYREMPGYREGVNGYLVWMGDRDTYRDYYRKGYKEGFEDAQHYRPRRYGRDDVEAVLGARLKDVYSEDRYDDDYDHRRRRDHDDHRGRYSRDEVYRIAYQNGYSDGFRHGGEDGERHRSYNYEHASRYREATRGYRSEYGDRDFYRRAYREGYRRGYDDGYRRSYRRWPF